MDGVPRVRRNRGLARPDIACRRRRSTRRTVTADGAGRRQDLQRAGRLLGYNSIAQSGQLGRSAQPRCVGHPARREALHPLHERRAQAAGVIGRPWCGTGERLPSSDGGGVRSPGSGPLFVGIDSVNNGSATAEKGGRKPAPGRRLRALISLTWGAGSSRAAAEGRVKSPLPWRWFGEPLVPSDAFGVGRSHSTSSARFGPWPPRLRLSGCWLPPLAPRLLVGVFSSGDPLGRPGGEEDPLSTVRGSDVSGAKHAPARIEPEVGQGAEYGTECAHNRLACGVSQTPQAEFHVARGTGGRGEEPADILDHHQTGVEGFDGAHDVVPEPGAGAFGKSGAAAGDGDVFDRGTQPSGRTPRGCWPSSRW